MASLPRHDRQLSLALRPSPQPDAPHQPPFVTQPSLLFADEPTGNLDTHTGQAIIELLFELNAHAGTTLVLVTHDEHLASRCSRLLRLDSGRLVSS